MAVYTKIDEKNLLELLNNYNLGELKGFEGILEGVENTNYKIFTSHNVYILTIFEKRVNDVELPFFIELQNYLYSKNIKCPQPITDNNKKYINKILNKNCVIMSFLKGKKLNIVNEKHCYQVGNELAKMHNNTNDFSMKRNNSLEQSSWKEIFNKCKKASSNIYFNTFELVENELNFVQKNWPNDLPRGVIHADVFQDNVFFTNNKLSGLIDFYFACNDYYAYDLAICINAWCFDKQGNCDINKYNNIVNGYESLRKLTTNEKNSLGVLLLGAAMRFFLTRLHDHLFHPKNAFVKPKDPIEYYNIIKYHRSNLND